MSAYVIAELGACHDGDLHAIREGIREAKRCGADAIKLQWTSGPYRMAQRRGKALEDGYGDIYRRYLTWPAQLHESFRAECDAAGIDYMCTVFLPEDVAVIAPFVKHFKIASFEAEDRELWEAHEPYVTIHNREVRMFASLGMGAMPPALPWLYRVEFLRCVSSYPAPHGALELESLRGDDPAHDGLSDHTAPELTWTGALAVAAGASIIEAHFRLDHTDPDNPDYPHAMSPAQLREYICNIRFAEECLGNGSDEMQDCEKPMSRYKVKGEIVEPTTEAGTA